MADLPEEFLSTNSTSHHTINDSSMSFHNKTAAVKPSEKEATSDLIWVAILSCEDYPESILSMTDYLWIKCRKQLTVREIREDYNRWCGSGDVVALQLDKSLLDDEVTIDALDTYGDHIVALEAIRSIDNQTRMASRDQPIQSSNQQPSQQKDIMPTPGIVVSPLIAEQPKKSVDIEKSQKTFQLQSFIADANLETLESSVSRGVQFLHDLKQPLLNTKKSSQDAAEWIQKIEKIQGQAVKTKTVIGVVGNTGAGKSSVINAMLDEERLVPTNCMRACTAVVTEISWNDSDHGYRAEIEFITVADWEKELKILFQDLVDCNGEVLRECTKDDTDAGIAYAKIKAVYPQKSKEDISKCDIEQMLLEVSSILGETENITEDDSLIFYNQLQKFVDSKERATSKKKEQRERELWPLIKVVRIFVRSDALATGAVIVDLPGSHDSNAARAAVAEGYMKQCTGLWIVAPINRAVDDRAARNLLGVAFKRQLKMDGGFDSVTFICSKTDDISLQEVQDTLGLEEEMTDGWNEIDAYTVQRRSLREELEQIEKSGVIYGEIIKDAAQKLKIWRGLRKQVKDGKIVYAPLESKKRKQSNIINSQRKKQRLGDDERENDYTDEASESSTSEDEINEVIKFEDLSAEGIPLTEEAVTAKIAELRKAQKKATHQSDEVSPKLRAVKEKTAQVKKGIKKVKDDMLHLCISGRNNYSKDAIQQDYAQGIKDLDQDNVAEEAENSVNPDIEVRDYQELARSLPVFCVSSRGYQKLKGRLHKDPAVPGFRAIEDTEIPQLQDHCQHLTVAGRTTNCKRFMTNLSQLLNSMSLWASKDDSGPKMTEAQWTIANESLQNNLEKLESGLDKLVESACKEIGEEFAQNIYDKFEAAIATAEKSATKTAAKWGSPVNPEDRTAGGYHWKTYRAIARRNGTYSNGRGKIDWNAELTDPMMKKLASGWERTFSRRTVSVIKLFARNSTILLESFHNDVDVHARGEGADDTGLQLMSQQVSIYNKIFKDMFVSIRQKIKAKQKDVNRKFTPVIKEAMVQAYEICTDQHGSGSYNRMKAVMTGHVDKVRQTMFHKSTEEVRHQLSEMVHTIEEDMRNKVGEVFVAIRQDYRWVLGGGDVTQGDIQQEMRKCVMAIIDKAGKVFLEPIGIEIELNEKGEESQESSAEDKNQSEIKPELAEITSISAEQASDVRRDDSEGGLDGKDCPLHALISTKESGSSHILDLYTLH